MQKKLWIAFLMVCILFVALLGRIMYIQYTSGAKYEKQVLSQLDYESTVIPYKRGDIVDVNGTILATSIDIYTLIMDAYVLSQNPDKIESTIREVTRSFPEISGDEMRRILDETPDSRYTRMLKDISYEDMMAFSEIMDNSEDSSISGIWFEKNYKRTYPYGSVAADVIGFVSADGVGAIGIENEYNDILSGVNGRTYGYVDDTGKRQVRTVPPENGKTVAVNLDINIQVILEKEIREFNERMGGGEGARGSLETAGIIMNPQSGQVYAMADYPTFDLNNPRDLENVYSPEELEAMTAEEKMDKLNELWQNFTITHTYEPGSTFKPFTVACGLETGKLSGDEYFYCDGGEHISGSTIRCVNRNGHGSISIEQSLMESCNDALMQMSYLIGSDNFADYQRLFGFGQRTNVDITGEARTDSLIYSKEMLGRTINMATNSFGQNFNTTMIQLACAFSSLINGGKLYEPHVVKSVLDSTGNIYEDKQPVVEKVTVSEETSDIMRKYLEAVVSRGTGATAGVEGYSIGGKTGTAEKLPRDQGNYLVSFIGFAPVEDPQVLVYIVVDEPATEDQAHSSYAQEIAHNVFEQILPYLNVKTITQEAAQ